MAKKVLYRKLFTEESNLVGLEGIDLIYYLKYLKYDYLPLCYGDGETDDSTIIQDRIDAGFDPLKSRYGKVFMIKHPINVTNGVKFIGGDVSRSFFELEYCCDFYLGHYFTTEYEEVFQYSTLPLWVINQQNRRFSRRVNESRR